jgi:LacI family transcriptional regulator, repressor for deo operon, udp, cdd, tsx, nupC, and nupG
MSTFGITLQRRGWSPRSEQFYSQLLVGLEDEVISRGHTVIVQTVGSRQEEHETFARWAADGSVDAVVCKDIAIGDDLEDRMHELGVPYVVLGDTQQPISANAVVVDNVTSLRSVIDHFRAAGHSRIDWITGPVTQFHTHLRLEAFAQYLADGVIEGETHPANYDADRCQELVTAAMGREKPPTAFLIDGAFLATATLTCLRRLGFSVPGDVSIISWDDSLICQRSEPPLSALDHHVGELGHGVGKCLIAAVEHRKLRIGGPMPSLVSRESSN